MNAQLPPNLLVWALQSAAVTLIAASLPRVLRIWSPGARLLFWRSVLTACLLLPVLQRWETRPALDAAPVRSTYHVDVLGVLRGAALAPNGSGLWPTPERSWWQTPQWRTVVQDVVLAGILLRLGWLGLGFITVSRLRRAARRLWPRPPSVDRATGLAETDAEFLVSPTASRPVTCGLLWPVVIVPCTFESFPEPEQTAIACHELLHVGRADWVRTLLDELVRTALWFHPAIWWLTDQIQLAREQVVDREAVKRLGAKRSYLEALLRQARPVPRLVFTSASLFLKREHLRRRVTLLVRDAAMSRARLVVSFAVMVTVVFVGAGFVTSALPLRQEGAPRAGASAAPSRRRRRRARGADDRNRPDDRT